MRLLITGGAGFIGVNLVRRALAAGHRVVCLDALTYAGNRRSLQGLKQADGFRFVHGDIGDAALVARLLAEERPQAILNLAAETHVDRSIETPSAFVQTNVVGTQRLLECACRYRDGLPNDARDAFRFIHVSTDEVFGSCVEGAFDEISPMRPASPYSASKAGADHLVSAYMATYGLACVTTHCTNNYGPYQFPEKLIPLVLSKALTGAPIPVYGDGTNVRDWLFVADHCDALLKIAAADAPAPRYVIGSGRDTRNIDLVGEICAALDRLRPRGRGSHGDLITFVADRPGHDFRYAVRPDLIRRDLGWTATTVLKDGLEATIGWYLENQAWMDAIRARQTIGTRLGLKLHA